MYLISCLLISISFHSGVSELLQCRSCEGVPSDEGEICSTDCVGDYCYRSYFYYPDDQYIHSNAGCLVGSWPSVGCRANVDGNVMCICSDSQCNMNSSVTLVDDVIRLPPQICSVAEDDGILPSSRWNRPCAGSYCSYKQVQYSFTNETQSSLVVDCSEIDDFDLFSSNAVLFFYTNNCVQLVYGGSKNEVACYGNQIDYTTLTFPSANLIECHVDFYSQALPYVKTGETCMGEMCFISSDAQGSVYRGCVSFAQSLAGNAMQPGYYKSHNNWEEWLCGSMLCNFDLYAAETSWPAELAVYRNISRLQQLNVFYVINATPTTPKWLWFFLVLFKLL